MPSPATSISAGAIASIFAGDEYIGRPSSYWKTYRDRARKVTRKQVQQVAREHLDPSKLVMLIVGNWDEIKAGDSDGRATMAEFFDGKATQIPLRDPMTLEPIEE